MKRGFTPQKGSFEAFLIKALASVHSKRREKGQMKPK
jgi:hypothetical protein